MRVLRLLNPNALIRLSAERTPALPSPGHLCVCVCVCVLVFVAAVHEESARGDGCGSSFKPELAGELSN